MICVDKDEDEEGDDKKSENMGGEEKGDNNVATRTNVATRSDEQASHRATTILCSG